MKSHTYFSGRLAFAAVPKPGSQPPRAQPTEAVYTYSVGEGCGFQCRFPEPRPKKFPDRLGLRFFQVGLKFCLILFCLWWSFLNLQIPRPTSLQVLVCNKDRELSLLFFKLW